MSVEILFAHCDAPLPTDFAFPPPPENALPRLRQKWKCRRMAHFLLGEWLARKGLDRTLLNEIQRTESGRPYLNHSEIDFNISHSGEWVAVIFSKNVAKKAVGIDIEHPQKTRRFEDLIRHYANREELDALLFENKTPLNALSQRFYLSWCLREAILKSQGVGIVKLSEVRHLPAERQIYSAHCPKGTLHFYHQLPFFLAYFYEENATPTVWQWAGDWQKITEIQPLVYHVNRGFYE